MCESMLIPNKSNGKWKIKLLTRCEALTCNRSRNDINDNNYNKARNVKEKKVPTIFMEDLERERVKRELDKKSVERALLF